MAWSFDGDGALFRLVAEARRIRLAYLFDPRLAVHLSLIEPLPHQIVAVYGEMLPRQPLRFLLADDPGAGKTIMAGLYIKELFRVTPQPSLLADVSYQRIHRTTTISGTQTYQITFTSGFAAACVISIQAFWRHFSRECAESWPCRRDYGAPSETESLRHR